MSLVWDLSRGFLPAKDPICELPKSCSSIEQFAAELPKLLAASAVGRQIKNIPILMPTGLNDEAAERAMMVYSFICHAYVWENWRENKPRNVIPANIALALHYLSRRLGREPILSYASYALYNWRRIEAKEDVVLGNICLLQNFYGGMDEEWFVLPHVGIEYQAAPVIQSGTKMMEAVKARDLEEIIWWLGSMHSGLKNINEVMARIPDGCDPYIYYNRVRPFIIGWKSYVPGFPLPDGVAYSGVPEFFGNPQKFTGETGAQSTIIPSLDAFLGVGHADLLNGKPDIMKIYLQDMRNYMPKEHRKFLNNLEKSAKKNSLRDLVLENKNNSGLLNAYNSCLEEIIKFSDMHFDYATRYIHKQPQKGANNTTAGTGGTEFMVYLKKHRDERQACLIS